MVILANIENKSNAVIKKMIKFIKEVCICFIMLSLLFQSRYRINNSFRKNSSMTRSEIIFVFVPFDGFHGLMPINPMQLIVMKLL